MEEDLSFEATLHELSATVRLFLRGYSTEDIGGILKLHPRVIKRSVAAGLMAKRIAESEGRTVCPI